MLDEPTNHLDIHSVDLLVESLNKYEGSLILVSHDRYFISRIANKIWEIDEHKIREFKGTYAEWEDWKERNEQSKAKAKAQAAPIVAAAPVVKMEPKNQASKQQNNDQKKELQRLKNKFKQLEEKLKDKEAEKNKLEAQLSDPEVYGVKEKFQEAERNYQKSLQELGSMNAEYEKLFEEIMLMEQE